MLKTLCFAGALLVLAASPDQAQDYGTQRPNVVLIGLREFSTEMLMSGPEVQSLMAEGVTIPQAETPIPRGQPELAVLMTGLMPQVSEVRITENHPSLGNHLTLADRLQAVGYATLGAGFSPAPWEDLNFGVSHDEINPLSLDGRNNLMGQLEVLPREQPFFLWWCPEPSTPGREPEAEDIQEADRRLGELLKLLRRAGKHDDTLYILVSTGKPNNSPERRRSRASRRQGPMLVSLKGRTQAGVQQDVLASTMDVVPTILDFTQCNVEGLELAGQSLRELVTQGKPWERERMYGALYSTPDELQNPRSMRDPDLRSLTQLYSRDARWKYVLYTSDARQVFEDNTLGFLFSCGDQELFDLQADPTEQLNLAGAAEHQALVLELRRDLLRWWASNGSSRPPIRQFIMPLEPKPRGSRAQDARPNIVLLLSDDHDNEHFGFLGNEAVQMPVLDGLAEAGVIFTRAHVSSSRSRASMATLLTGKYPHQTKITANVARYELRTKDSLPNLLKESGYATFMGGRFYESNRYAMGFSAPQWEHEGKFVRQDQESLFEFLDAQADKRPLFIWWAPSIPSEPFNAPSHLKELFKDTRIEIPVGVTGTRKDYVDQELALMAMEAWFDEALGQLTKKLEALGQLDNTLFCFLTDNGSSNYRPSRGSVFEKGLATPIVFHYKDKLKAGLRSDELISSLDIFPTLLDYANVPLPEGTEGRSLRAILEGREAADARDSRPLFGAGFRSPREAGRHNTEMDLYAIYMRDERWKYVLYVRNVTPENTSILAPIGLYPARPVGKQELFDLSQDPYEFEDLGFKAEHQERMQRMRAAATEWWYATGGQPSKLLKR